MMLRSATPQVMAGKFQRFEQFTHSRYRCEIAADGEGGLAIRRFSVSGPPPVAVENLLIAGLLKAMLEEIGCREVTAEPGPEPFDRFNLRWAAFLPAHAGSDPMGMEAQRAREPLKVYGVDEARPLARRVVRLLTADISRNWACAEMARELGLSARTFQRRLKEEGTSLSAITRAVRTREACQLLTGSDFKLTEIGYWCGFSDSPHFSGIPACAGVPPALTGKRRPERYSPERAGTGALMRYNAPATGRTVEARQTALFDQISDPRGASWRPSFSLFI